MNAARICGFFPGVAAAFFGLLLAAPRAGRGQSEAPPPAAASRPVPDRTRDAEKKTPPEKAGPLDEPEEKTLETDAARNADDKDAAVEDGAGDTEPEPEKESENESERKPLGGNRTRYELGPAPDAEEFPAEFRADGSPEIRWEAATDPKALHGSVAADYAPRAFAGAHRRLERAGLGGINNYAGRDHLDYALQLSGPLIRDRLYYEVHYTPEWTRDAYRLDVSDDALARDRVVAPLARRDIALARRDAGGYAVRMDWRISDRHRLSLRMRGTPETADGILQLAGRRVDPLRDERIPVQPEPAGVPASDPWLGGRGARRLTDREGALRYTGELGRHTRVEIEAAGFERRTQESPGRGADSVRYFDIRREQMFNSQTLNHVSPRVSPAQYSFGGLGEFDSGSAERSARAGITLSHEFSALGAHQLKYGIEYADRRLRENILFSGPRGDQGLGVYLAVLAGVPIWDSFIRVRSGTMAEVSCLQVDPAQPDFDTACATPVFSALRGSLNPEAPYTRELRRAAFIQDRWRMGEFTLQLGLRYLAVAVNNPDRYSLNSALTGAVLEGPDGAPVCSRDRPDAPGPGGADLTQHPEKYSTRPNCILGPGQFTGSGARFPGEFEPRIGLGWDIGGRGSARLELRAGRFHDRIPGELALHAFSSEFGIARVSFFNPDLTNQSAPAATYGEDFRQAAPGTRLGYQDHVQLEFHWAPAPRWRVALEARASRQGRVLADTQATPMEEIANYFYDFFLQFPGRCANCDPKQTSLFPDYPAGTGFGSRAFSPETLANPGVNTPAGLFGKPVRQEQSVTASVEKTAGEAGHFAASATGRLARARGNYQGLIEQENGTGETKMTSLFAFPLSPLSRGQYASGPLDPSAPGFLRLQVKFTDLGVKDFSAALSCSWTEGTLRTPLIANPFNPYAGLIPGTAPQYYLFRLGSTPYPSRQVLRDYTPVERGSLGRNPGLSSWDLRLEYRRPLGGGTLAFSLKVENILNTTRVLGYDDAVETPMGYTEPVDGIANLAPPRPRFSPQPDSTRVLNPAYGMPLTVQNPRIVRLGAAWSF